jgi:gliding motility-associated-like protein
MKRLFTVLSSAALVLNVHAQKCNPGVLNPISKCFEINKILVDGCGLGNLEGENEMVLFQVGNKALNTANIQITWPNNSFQGIVKNTTTANVVKALNSKITGCGKLVEPVSGVLPANCRAILFGSTAFNTSLYDFAALDDTVYCVFQDAGNTAGHFANFQSGPGGSRTLIFSFKGTCADTVVYDRAKLVKLDGNPGAENGAYVSYTNNGVPTYKNDGCTALMPAMILNAGTGGSYCGATSVKLNALTAFGRCFSWRGGKGNFSDSTNPGATYYPAPGETGLVILTAVLRNNCRNITDTIRLNFGSAQVPDVQAARRFLCLPDTLHFSLSNPSNHTVQWTVNGKGSLSPQSNSGAVYNTHPSDSGWYFVQASWKAGSCTSSDTVQFFVAPKPRLSYTTPPTDVCLPHPDVPLFGNGNWFINDTLATSLQFKYAGTYKLRMQRCSAPGCCSQTDFLVNAHPKPAASIIPVKGSFKTGTLIAFSTPTKAKIFDWNFQDGDPATASKANENVRYANKGIKQIRLIVQDSFGCMDTALAEISIEDEPLDTSEVNIFVPNVFTPNSDSINDYFYPELKGINSFQMLIYNRWGQKVFETYTKEGKWNGKTSNGLLCPEGVYYGLIRATDFKNKQYEISVTITLLR